METLQSEICVVGAGISGLSLAHFLRRRNREVLVLEEASRPGGVIRTCRIDGFLFDEGPNSTLAASETLWQLIGELGLGDRVVRASEKAQNRFVLRDGRLRKVPLGPGDLLKSDLLSWKSRLRIVGELFVPANPNSATETVAQFVERRLGREFLDYVINPFVAGVYAGDPDSLGIQAAFRRVFELEERYGGLIRGFMAKQRESRKRGKTNRTRAPLVSFDQGMSVLPEALARSLGSRMRLGMTVTGITLENDRFVLDVVDSSGRRIQLKAAQVALAVPAPVAAGFLRNLDKGAAQALLEIPYAPVAVIFTGFHRTQVMHPLDGFGFLVPAKEHRRLLGTIWNSSLFPGRVPEAHVALTTFVGGARQPELLELADDELVELVVKELHAVLGISGDPVVTEVRRWPMAIPQYTVEHLERMDRVARLEKRYPGLYVTGNFRDGISVADCIDRAAKLAEVIAGTSQPVQQAQALA